VILFGEEPNPKALERAMAYARTQVAREERSMPSSPPSLKATARL